MTHAHWGFSKVMGFFTQIHIFTCLLHPRGRKTFKSRLKSPETCFFTYEVRWAAFFFYMLYKYILHMWATNDSHAIYFIQEIITRENNLRIKMFTYIRLWLAFSTCGWEFTHVETKHWHQKSREICFLACCKRHIFTSALLFSLWT